MQERKQYQDRTAGRILQHLQPKKIIRRQKNPQKSQNQTKKNADLKTRKQNNSPNTKNAEKFKKTRRNL